MRLTDFLQGVSSRQVQYYPDLVPILGSVTATILFGQLLYWRGKEATQDGWLFKSQAEIQLETALTREEQETARKKMRETGVLRERKKGIPCRLWYWLDLDKVNLLWQENYVNQKNGQIPQTCERDNHKQESVKAASKNEALPQATTDITTEITTKTKNTTQTPSSSLSTPIIPEAIKDIIPQNKRTHKHLVIVSAALVAAGEEITADNIRRALQSATSPDPWGMVMKMLHELAEGIDWYQLAREREAADIEKQAKANIHRQQEAKNDERKRHSESQRQVELMHIIDSLPDREEIEAAAKHECARIGVPLSSEILRGAALNILADRYPQYANF